MGRISLNKKEKDLLEVTAGDLIPLLKSDKELSHVKQQAFSYYDKDSKEFWQVQVVVTRDESEYLDFMQTEEMRMAT